MPATYWVIRQKSTGYLLPQTPAGTRGFTWQEPTSPEELPPRLYKTKKAASNNLNCWLKGHWVSENTMTHFDLDKDITNEHVIHYVKERNAEDMEVIPVRLQFVNPQELLAVNKYHR